MAKPKFINKDIVDEIREKYFSEKYTQKQLADKFNLSQSTICKIINNYIHKKNIDIFLNGKASIKIGYKYGNN